MPATRRLLVLCATTSIATLGGAGAALADPSGFISLGAGPLHAQFDFDPATFSQSGYGARGLASGVIEVTPVLGIQGDVLLGLDHFESDFDEYDRSTMDVALHGFYRDPERFLAGTFVQLGRDTVSHSFGDDTMDRVYFGGEAQVFVGDLTLYAQGGLQQFSFPDVPDFKQNGWFGTLEARYFLTPDLRIEAHAGLSKLSYDVGFDITATTVNLGIGAEYRLENLPVSLFASLDCFNLTYQPIGDFSMDHQRLLVGVRFGIGEDTLKDLDRNGASLKPVDSVGVSISPR